MFLKPKPTCTLCEINCKKESVTILGNDKGYVWVPKEYYGQVASIIGSALGRSVLTSEEKKVDGKFYRWQLLEDVYSSLKNIEHLRMEMAAKSRAPPQKPMESWEAEIANKLDKWRPPHHLIHLYVRKRELPENRPTLETSGAFS